MVKVNTIVKKLPSVETLGSVSVVCSDKTGTLTENKLKCEGIYQNGNFVENSVLEDEDLIMNIKLCNNAYKKGEEYIGSPIECALLQILDANNLDRVNHQRLEEKEFDSNRKMMSTLNMVNSKKIQFSKGAFDKIIDRCKYIRIDGEDRLITANDVENLKSEIDKQASKARRILSFAYKKGINEIEENNLVFLGFITFVDPPRAGIKEAIEKFERAGVKTVMITGDYAKTAYAIGKEVGIATNENECMTGEEIDQINDDDLAKIVENKSIFARVTPIHKARIITAFKKNDRIVAMTGDGVNDAPSLKKADIGISMGINGSDVAKEASDMILIDDNFTTIETAIEEGRTIYNNIKKSVLFLLSSNFAEIIVMLVAIVLGLPLPLLAIHVLVVNLLTDSIPALALGADLKEDDIMKEKPRKMNESLFANKGLINTVIYGVLIATLTLIAFFIPVLQEIRGMSMEFNLNNVNKILAEEEILLLCQTYAFIVLSLSELFYSILLRNIRKTIYRKDLFLNKYLNLAIIGGVGATWLMIFIPFFRSVLKLSSITTPAFIYLILISASVIFFHELVSLVVSHETRILNKNVKKR